MFIIEVINQTDFSKYWLGAGGKPPTKFPPGRLVELNWKRKIKKHIYNIQQIKVACVKCCFFLWCWFTKYVRDMNVQQKYRNPFNHPSIIYRKSKVIAAGGPRNFTGFDDYYLWIRMFNVNTKCANLGKPLIYMRANVNQAKRRGGYQYLKNEIKFFLFLKSIKHISYMQFFVNILIRLPIRLIPYKFRYFIYKFLKKW